jgi:hypothetical protein
MQNLDTSSVWLPKHASIPVQFSTKQAFKNTSESSTKCLATTQLCSRKAEEHQKQVPNGLPPSGFAAERLAQHVGNCLAKPHASFAPRLLGCLAFGVMCYWVGAGLLGCLAFRLLFCWVGAGLLAC